MLTKEFETPKRIAVRRGKSIQSVYKIINKLRQKGFLTRGFNKGLKKLTTTRTSQPPIKLKRYIRLHGQEWNIQILYKSRYYEQIRQKNTIFDQDGNTIRLYKDSIEVYANQHLKFEAEDEHRATTLSFNYWQRVFTRLENKLKIIIIKANYSNIKLVNHSYAEVNNEIAKEYNKNRIKLRIFTTEDGKLWFEINHSWNLDEAETKHTDTAKQDMTNIKRYFNDIRDNKPPLNSEIAKHIGKILVIQENTAKQNQFYAKNIKAHARFVKQAEKLLKKINDKLSQKRLNEYL